MKILLVGGSFDLNNGKESGLIKKMSSYIKEKSYDLTVYNGGHYNDLKNIINSAKEYEVIFWMASVPNDLPKIRNVKTINPYALVIGSKRNDNEKYSFVEILNRALEQRNNLTIEFSKENNRFKMLVFDPLGSSWYKGTDLNECLDTLLNRVEFLLTTRREHTYKIDKTSAIPDNEEFFEYVRNVAEIFHKTIEHSDDVTKLLGNASYRVPNNNHIFVTERDINKAVINKETIVEVFLDNDKERSDLTKFSKENSRDEVSVDKVYYYGDKKPSKDTVVQVRLYKMFSNINYIVHSHCFVEGGYFTNNSVPCGSLDEIDEVLEVIKNFYNNDFSLDYYKINLKGHGCLILGNNIDILKKSKYITRHLPENLEEK